MEVRSETGTITSIHWLRGNPANIEVTGFGDDRSPGPDRSSQRIRVTAMPGMETVRLALTKKR
jgi:hypothetical protein